MNVPPGYKRTKVGVIPEDWDVRPLRECLRGTPGYGINAAAVPYDDSLPTYLRITDINGDGRFVPDPRVSVRHSSAGNYFLEKGDLVFARTGASVGKSYLYDPCDGPLVFAGFLIRIKPNSSLLDSAFLAYFVQSKVYWDWVSMMSVRSGQPGINGQEYGSLVLPVPNPAEQRAIAAVLSDIDGLIRSLDKLIAKKRAIKQAAMQELLTGKNRLPGFEREWNNMTLRQLCEVVSGGTPSTVIKSYWDGTIPWCTPTDITANGDKYLRGTGRCITNEGLKNSGANLLPAGSILLCTRATIGEMKIAMESVCTNQGFKSLICNSDACNEFVYYKLMTIKSRLVEKGAGSTFLEVSKKDIANLVLNVPDVEEQRAIATVLSDMDAEIAALDQRRDKTKAIKQGMMQALLTGRVRLVTPGKEV
jgi:type I restriction enzyme S subunit